MPKAPDSAFGSRHSALTLSAFGLRHSELTARARTSSARGFTFVELLVVTTIMLILASAVMPLARVSVQRDARSRAAARPARDARRDRQVQGRRGRRASSRPPSSRPGAENYPPDLQTLVDGVAVNNDQTGRKLKFLRRIPSIPMTHSTDWGLRSYQDKPDSTSWGGGNVFDVYTKSDGKALDGTKYKDW